MRCSKLTKPLAATPSEGTFGDYKPHYEEERFHAGVSVCNKSLWLGWGFRFFQPLAAAQTCDFARCTGLRGVLTTSDCGRNTEKQVPLCPARVLLCT